MSTAQITRSPIPLTAAVAAFVAAVAFTGVAVAQHNNGSDAPATHIQHDVPGVQHRAPLALRRAARHAVSQPSRGSLTFPFPPDAHPGTGTSGDYADQSSRSNA